MARLPKTRIECSPTSSTAKVKLIIHRPPHGLIAMRSINIGVLGGQLEMPLFGGSCLFAATRRSNRSPIRAGYPISHKRHWSSSPFRKVQTGTTSRRKQGYTLHFAGSVN